MFKSYNFEDFPHDDLYKKLDWEKIRKFQFQVSSNTDAHVELEFVEIELNNGKTYIINSGSSDNVSYVAVESINIILKTGQTVANNGYHLSSNAHGAPYMNVSYFMRTDSRDPSELLSIRRTDPEGRFYLLQCKARHLL